MHDLVIVKGSREGLRITLDDTAEWHAVLSALHTHLDQSGSFFAGARFLLDVGDRAVNEQQLAEVLDLMDQHGIRPEAVAATARDSRNAARSAGLTVRIAPPSAPAAPGLPAEGDATLVMRTVRSGQVIRHPGPRYPDWRCESGRRGHCRR